MSLGILNEIPSEPSILLNGLRLHRYHSQRRGSDERAAAGRHSLKVTDSATLQPSWQPHFYYEPHRICVEIQAALGKNAARTFQLTLTPEGEQPRVFSGLSMRGQQFSEVHWLGFSSTAMADTVFYLDNVRIHRLEE